ncbi:MAG: AAA family ATPase [Proteobacteria bacterium]|nr:AAA family ATPase [Pseudomonadota bacterium]
MDIPYLEYFSLNEKPFGLTPDPLFYYESTTHREAIDHLKFFLSQKEGFACIYGDVGTGKTVLSRTFLGSLDKSLYNTALILNPIMDEKEFLLETLKELNISHDNPSKKEMFDKFQLFLLEEFKKGKETIIIIDEAQLLSDDMLEFIRVLSNLETEKEKILHTILFGQQELIEKLKEPRMRYLSQRITVIYRLKPLSLREVNLYITHRLLKAGSKGFLQFKDDAIKLIYSASKGYPRIVNVICDRCLILLYSKSERTVDEDIVNMVLQEESISTLAEMIKIKKRLPALPYLIAALIAVILLLSSLFNLIPIEKIIHNILTSNTYKGGFK